MRTAESSFFPQLPDNDSVTQVLGPCDFQPLPFSQLAVAKWPRIRGYELLSIIGIGGMGIVYKARHSELRRTVAIKMLCGPGLADPDFHRRFHAEAEAVARVQHPNIIQVFEIGKAEPQSGDLHSIPFIALEFVDGGSLARQTDRPQPARQAAETIEKLARAVHSAHRLGVVHRDLKPANVLLTQEGEPKIVDFGLAKQLGTERDAGGRFVTQAGIVMGTPEYMAPEQAACETPTPAIDIYALGVILYELLTARVPFQGANPLETLHIARHQEPVPPRRLQPDLPRDLETICLKCLRKDPSKRYDSALALADDLRAFLSGRPILARRANDFEKSLQWCRRNPLVSISLAGAIGIFLVAFVLVSQSYWRADAALQQEAHQRREAERKEKAERWERYRASIVASGSALRVYDVGSARRTLEDAPEEHRNWEWRHFQSRLDLARQSRGPAGIALLTACMTPDGRRTILFGEDGFVQAWDSIAGKEVRTFAKSREMWDAILSSDGQRLAYRTGDNTVTVRHIDTGQVLAVLRGHEMPVHTLQFSADGFRLVTGSHDRSVRFWDIATGQQIREFRPPSGVGGMKMSADGSRLVTVDRARREVRLWEVDTEKEIANLAGHGRGLLGICFNRQGDRVVTIEEFPSNVLRLWNAVNGQPIGVLGRHGNSVTEVFFSDDGTRIASCSMDQCIGLWDGVTGQPVAMLKGHNGRVNWASFSPNGKHLASASQDHTVRLWDAEHGTPLTVLNGHTASVFAVAFSADGNSIVSASKDGTVRLWDAHLAQSNGILRGHTAFVYSVAFHPDGERVASAGWDGTARIWNSSNGRQQALLDHGANAIVTSVAFHPAGRMLASRVRESIVLWDVESGQQLQRWNAPSDRWRDTRLAFSSRGDLLASGCRGGEVRLWDVQTKAEVAVLRGQGDEVRDVAFSPDGRWLATAGEVGDKSVRIWDVAGRKQIHVLGGHNDCVYSLAFSRDGRWLASGSTDGTVRLWDTQAWRSSAVLRHGTNVYGLAFTPDGTRLACACADNSIRFWDVASRQAVAELRGHADYVHAIAFNPDATRLVSGSGDFTVRVWETVGSQDRPRGQTAAIE